MHNLTTDWKPRESKSRKGKPWRVVIPARISLTGKQSSRYFETQEAAERFIAEQIRNLKRFGNVNGKAIDIDAYKWATVDEILEGIGVTPIEAASHYAALVKEAGSVAKLRTLIELGRGVAPPDADRSPILKDLATMAEKRKKNLSAVTVASRRARLSKLERLCPDIAIMPCAIITPEMLREALDKCHAGHEVSWNNLRRELATLFNFAIKLGYVVKNPCKSIDKMLVREQEIIALTPAQLISLFKACSPPREVDPQASEYQKRLAGQDTSGLFLYIALGAFAGIRPFELTRLTWADISLEDNVVSIRAKHSKTGGARHVSIHPALLAWIRFCMPEAADPASLVIEKTDLKTKTYALRIRAGWNDANPWPHDCLRHSFASYSIKNGHDINQLSNDMGHVNLALLKTRYLNMRGLTKESAADWWSITPQKLKFEKL